MDESLLRSGGRAVTLMLCLLACLVAAACAPHDGNADQDPHRGFYGGVSAGM